MNEIVRICFVRHGETDWNLALRLQGQRDLPLNARGLEQAAGTLRYFSRLRIDALYCSDLLRARQTALALAETQGVQLNLEPALRERHFGRCEGLTVDEIARSSAEDALALKVRDPDYVLPGGESLRQHQERVLECIDRLAAAHAGQNIVVVTHGGVLDLIYRRACDLPLEQPRDFPIPNAAVNWVAVRGDCWAVEQWGVTAHLGEAAPIDLVAKV